MIHVSDRLQVLLSNIAAQGIRVIATMFLMRLLTPAEHGKFAVLTLMTGLFASFGNMGLPQLLVQKRDWPEEQVRDTIAVLLYAVGTALLIVNVGCGWYLAHAQHDIVYFWLGAGLGVTALLTAIYDTQLAVMSRRLAFRSEVRQQLIFAAAQALSGIAFAVAGFGVYTLALQPVVAQIIANGTIQRYEPLRWPRHFRWALAQTCVRPALQIGLTYYFAVVVTPVQKYFLLRSSNKEVMTLFEKLFQLRETVTFSLIQQAFARLIFPLFSVHQHDSVRLRDVFVRGCASVVTFVTFCGWGLAITSPELVGFLAGPQWAFQDPNWIRVICLPLLCTTGAGAVAIFLCTATNRSHIGALHSAFLMAFSAIGGYFSFHNGPTTVSFVFAIAQIIASIGVIAWALHALQLSWLILLRRLSAPILIAATAGLLAFFAKEKFFFGGSPWSRLFVTGVLFTALYMILVWLFDSESVNELRRLVRRRQPSTEEA